VVPPKKTNMQEQEMKVTCRVSEVAARAITDDEKTNSRPFDETIPMTEAQVEFGHESKYPVSSLVADHLCYVKRPK